MKPTKFDLSDLLVLLGVAAVIWGVYLYSKPAALILGGALLFLAGINSGRTPKVKN